MDQVLDKLTEYVLALSGAIDTDGIAGDRQQLTNHLAVAAKMFAILHEHKNVSAIHKIVQSESRNHGWSYIAGKSGDLIATKWVAFEKSIDVQI